MTIILTMDDINRFSTISTIFNNIAKMDEIDVDLVVTNEEMLVLEDLSRDKMIISLSDLIKKGNKFLNILNKFKINEHGLILKINTFINTSNDLITLYNVLEKYSNIYKDITIEFVNIDDLRNVYDISRNEDVNDLIDIMNGRMSKINDLTNVTDMNDTDSTMNNTNSTNIDIDATEVDNTNCINRKHSNEITVMTNELIKLNNLDIIIPNNTYSFTLIESKNGQIRSIDGFADIMKLSLIDNDNFNHVVIPINCNKLFEITNSKTYTVSGYADSMVLHVNLTNSVFVIPYQCTYKIDISGNRNVTKVFGSSKIMMLHETGLRGKFIIPDVCKAINVKRTKINKLIGSADIINISNTAISGEYTILKCEQNISFNCSNTNITKVYGYANKMKMSNTLLHGDISIPEQCTMLFDINNTNVNTVKGVADVIVLPNGQKNQ